VGECEEERGSALCGCGYIRLESGVANRYAYVQIIGGLCVTPPNIYEQKEAFINLGCSGACIPRQKGDTTQPHSHTHFKMCVRMRLRNILLLCLR